MHHQILLALILGASSGATALGTAVGGSYVYLTSREAMKTRDEEIEEKRKRERAEEAALNRKTRPRRESFSHFAHKHPLVEVDSESIKCGGCGVCNQTVAGGWALHCSLCNYFLHEVCAKDLVALSPCSYSRAKEIQSPVDPTIISTFAHEKHPVKEVYSNIEYKCNHCYTAGYGKRFRCDSCELDLHPICATHPTKISSFMHPQHDLELKTRRHFSVCSICNNKAGSNTRMYRCKMCKVYVHPACSQLPQHLMDDLHPLHPLQLRPAECSRRCDAKCGSNCEVGRWCYECKCCNVSIHIRCVLQQFIRDKFKTDKDQIRQLLTHVPKITEAIIGIAHLCLV